MINASYYKDFRHNYLIIKGEDSDTGLYQCRMITDNRIDGLIPCQERHVNGEVLLYYEITSKQNLLSLYEDKRISMKQLRSLFMQLKTTWEKISGFLLDESKLVLKPEYIFADVETEEIFFLYYPFEAEENYIVSLLEFLTERVDSEDQDATETVYKMLELAIKDQFVPDEVLQWFEEDCEYVSRQDDQIRDVMEEDIFSAPEPPEGEAEGISIRTKAAGAGIILALGVFGICCYINSFYLLSEKMQIFLYAVIILAVILFLAGTGIFIYGSFVEKKRGEGGQTEKRQKNERNPEKEYRETVLCDQIQEKAGQAYGNTIFIPMVENFENKLYGVGKSNKNHIDLNHLPLTVGKLAGSVDMVIQDQSISRRHAKFFREGNKIFMSDLNSTNGSFKNGLRLLPNASEALEPGDEIRLGKLKFIYR